MKEGMEEKTDEGKKEQTKMTRQKGKREIQR